MNARPERLDLYRDRQLAGTLSDKKYEKEGGPGIVACASLVRRYSSQPAIDLMRLLQWLFFNLYIGNNDGHAKNLSFYWLPDGRVMLTPFYDLMNTRLYPGLSREFAFSIGGETRPGDICRQHLEKMADDLGMGRRFVLSQAAAVARRVPAALALAIGELSPGLSGSAKVLAQHLQDHVLSTTRQMAERFSRPSPAAAA